MDIFGMFGDSCKGKRDKVGDCFAAATRDEKFRIADRLLQEYAGSHLAASLAEICQYDFKLCSLVAYRLMARFYASAKTSCLEEPKVPMVYQPVSYVGGSITFGRLFSVNMCAFTSPDSIIGFRNAEVDRPLECFRVLKGLRLAGTLRNWTLFKLDTATSDDMTGILYLPLEKNFTIEAAHFPHDADRRIIYRWNDC